MVKQQMDPRQGVGVALQHVGAALDTWAPDGQIIEALLENEWGGVGWGLALLLLMLVLLRTCSSRMVKEQQVPHQGVGGMVWRGWGGGGTSR